VDRLAAGDEIWLAVRASGAGGRKGRGRERDPRVRKCCRLLGFGLLAVFARGQVEVIVAPRPWKPRKVARRRLVDEHQRRQGDRPPAAAPPADRDRHRQPRRGGGRPRRSRGRRHDGAQRAPGAGRAPASPRTRQILLHNVYGWLPAWARGAGADGGGRAALVRWGCRLVGNDDRTYLKTTCTGSRRRTRWIAFPLKILDQRVLVFERRGYPCEDDWPAACHTAIFDVKMILTSIASPQVG
jgi:hypothetical protein